MYAVVDSGGKQYRVEAGSTLVVERLDAAAGSLVDLRPRPPDRGRRRGDGRHAHRERRVGQWNVLGTGVGPKIIVFQFQQKVKYRRAPASARR